MSNNFPIILKGKKSGKTSVILAGTHGNETCGVKAFEKILKKLKIDKGTVIFDIGNPEALKKNVRFIGMNLNRAIKDKKLFLQKELKTYEFKRSQELKIILNKADALLDIHSSLNKNSKKFIICESESDKISKQLPFNLRVRGFDKFEEGGTDGFMHRQNKIGICVECGQHEDNSAVTLAERSIKSFLIAMGHVHGKNNNVKQKLIKINFLYKNKSKNFILSREFKDFEKIKKGTAIGTDGKKQITSPYDCFIIFAHSRSGKINQECFLLGI